MRGPGIAIFCASPPWARDEARLRKAVQLHRAETIEPEVVGCRVYLELQTRRRLKGREDGDRERAIADRLRVERQAREPGARTR